MAEHPEKPEGDNIEQLLSQLKGIFGHLSDSEKEESKQKITPPYTPPPETSASAPVLSEPSVPPSESEAAPQEIFEPPPFDPTAPSEMPALEPWVAAETPATVAPLTNPDGFTPAEINMAPGTALIPTMIFYPAGRINEAKVVAEKVERITPKFTKVPSCSTFRR